MILPFSLNNKRKGVLKMDDFNRELYTRNNIITDEKLEDHEKRLTTIADRVVKLEIDGREYHTNIDNLIKKMDSFINTVKWGMGIFITLSLSLIGILLKQ